MVLDTSPLLCICVISINSNSFPSTFFNEQNFLIVLSLNFPISILLPFKILLKKKSNIMINSNILCYIYCVFSHYILLGILGILLIAVQF